MTKMNSTGVKKALILMQSEPCRSQGHGSLRRHRLRFREPAMCCAVLPLRFIACPG